MYNIEVDLVCTAVNFVLPGDRTVIGRCKSGINAYLKLVAVNCEFC
jgi:Flp pilus assembly protein CpaB